MSGRSFIARTAGVTTLAWFAFGGASAIASAHAEFQSTRVTAGATTSVTLDVPHERAPNVFNTIVRMQVPAGWNSPSCAAPAGWNCSAGGSEVAFSKLDPNSMVDASEAFTFSLTAPMSSGLTTFPVVQIYNTGENVLWSDSARLEVVAAPTPTSAAPAPTPTTAAPGPTTPAPTTPGGSAVTTTAVDGTAGDSRSSSTSTSADHDGEPTLTDATSESRDSGMSPIVPIGIGIVVVAAVTGGVVLLRKRSS